LSDPANHGRPYGGHQNGRSEFVNESERIDDGIPSKERCI